MTTTPGVDNEALSGWLVERLPTIRPPLHIELITGGRSNLTFKLTDAMQQRFILRRPPLGEVLETAHDVVREFRIMQGVGQTSVPVPRTVAACEDKAVLGAPFTLVRFVDGAVLHNETSARQLSAAERMALGFDVVEVLARLHLVDPDAVGLGQLGRREGYIERQLRRWARQWEAQKEREMPAMDEVRQWLEQKVPQQRRCSIVHGDYRPGNLISANGKVQAVLDWELCTLGDPLADMGYLLNNWVTPDEEAVWEQPPTRAGGFPTREQLLNHYATLTGFDLSQIHYYQAFAYWRFAAILEGVRIRHAQGAHGETHVDLAQLSRSVERFATMALEQIQ